jgi:antitoxin CptB
LPDDRIWKLSNQKRLIMTGTTRSSADLDPRRRRILVRAWRRGIREMDLVIGGFTDAEIATLSDTELDELELLMAEEDADIFRWVTGEAETPERFRTALFDRMRAYVPDFEPSDPTSEGQASRS